MAGLLDAPLSLMSLGDELTCSICLSTFDCPVTIPCGHNFCQDCLLAIWKDTYSCPQCRTHFSTKPELRKNTVLSTVVETFNQRSSKGEVNLYEAEEEEAKNVEGKDAVRCDTCMEAEASQTCLTCMASFCEEHLRPHRDNPKFAVHQLSDTVVDLSERICADHHKLMELFCSQHSRPICSLCVQHGHKGCALLSVEEQRGLKESELRDKLGFLDGKIERTETVMIQIKDAQSKLKDGAVNRKAALAAAYQQMRDMLAQEERQAQSEVDHELEMGQTRLQDFNNRLTDNTSKMTEAREKIHSLLSQSQTPAFLQASFHLPKVVKFDPYTPRVNLDFKKVAATQAFASALKEYLTETLKQPVEARLPLFKPGEQADRKAASASGGTSTGSTGPQREPGWPNTQPHIHPHSYRGAQQSWNPSHFPQGMTSGFKRGPPPGVGQRGNQRSDGGHHGPHNTGRQPLRKQTKKPSQSTENTMGRKGLARSMENLLKIGVTDKPLSFSTAAAPSEKPETSDIPLNITSAKNRNELLKYAAVLTLNPNTAHKRIVLTEDFTKASVSEEHINYPDCAERFAVCSQVLASTGFSSGRHYWEVRLSSNNFISVGLAYGSIDRKGPTSRLGRNAQSWCVEWFNIKLSAWHNSSETVLANANPECVGVLLNCDEGVATFYNVADRAYPLHSFVFPFAEPVYPAFWIISSSSSVTLCKMQA